MSPPNVQRRALRLVPPTLRAGLLAKRHHDAISARTGIEQMRKAVQRVNFKTFRG